MFKTIVVATDFSELADAALDRACELARESAASLHVLHVIDSLFQEPWVGWVSAEALSAEIDRDKTAARTQLEAALAKRGCQGKATIVVTVEHGTAVAAQIVTYAGQHHADLIVCGTHGRSGIGRVMLGSIADQVCRTAPCPVLTVNGSVVAAPAAT